MKNLTKEVHLIDVEYPIFSISNQAPPPNYLLKGLTSNIIADKRIPTYKELKVDIHLRTASINDPQLCSK